MHNHLFVCALSTFSISFPFSFFPFDPLGPDLGTGPQASFSLTTGRDEEEVRTVFVIIIIIIVYTYLLLLMTILRTNNFLLLLSHTR
jgi:hypothetical protein